jgi:hypothetical protein
MAKSQVFAPAARLPGVTATVTPFVVSFCVAICAARVEREQGGHREYQEPVSHHGPFFNQFRGGLSEGSPLPAHPHAAFGRPDGCPAFASCAAMLATSGSVSA